MVTLYVKTLKDGSQRIHKSQACSMGGPRGEAEIIMLCVINVKQFMFGLPSHSMRHHAQHLPSRAKGMIHD